MPCCTLLAILLSQPALFYSAVKTRLFGRGTSGRVALIEADARQGWRQVGIAGAIALELVLACAAAPYILTGAGRTATAESATALWHICSLGNVLGSGLRGAAIR